MTGWLSALREFWHDWREFREHPQRCMAFGGVMPDGRIRACDKNRFHGDSHTYDWIKT